MRIAFINLSLVALLGVTMRYKIAYSLPFIEQKKFLHAHSHFAFAGWITQALMILLVAYLAGKSATPVLKKYRSILTANLVCAYGMLLSFPFQGYGSFSITFSTLSIFVSYAFAVMYWRDLNRLHIKHISHLWFKAAILFNAISSIGAFTLAGMMAAKMMHPDWYLEAIYFFLHFQYNGWFFFACMGLLADKMHMPGIVPRNAKIIFWLFAGACLPAYILSVLWLPLPIWAYIIVVLSAAAQVSAWLFLIFTIYRHPGFIKIFSRPVKWLLLLSALSLTSKLLLQLGSTIPFLSHLAFGFRPIVIAYLHLVLLGVISVFIIACVIAGNYIHLNKIFYRGIFVFITGIFLNEVLLTIQGIGYLNYASVPYTNEMLLIIAFIMLAGILLCNISQIKVMRNTDAGHIS